MSISISLRHLAVEIRKISSSCVGWLFGALLAAFIVDVALAQPQGLPIPNLPCMTAADQSKLQKLSAEYRYVQYQIEQTIKRDTEIQVALNAVSGRPDLIRPGIAAERQALQRQYDRLVRQSGAIYDEYKKLISEIGRRCNEPLIAPTPMEPISLPFNPYAFNYEATIFGGGVAASSFGADYSTYIIGGRSAVGIRLPGQFRLQVDVEGERTGDYCSTCGDASYLAGGAHLDYQFVGNGRIGLFGGFQSMSPTFFAPDSTNSFVGVEARVNVNDLWGTRGMSGSIPPGISIGGKAGYFDVSSGPGTLTDAYFAEFNTWWDFKLAGQPATFSGGVGHASGKLSNTGFDADSTYWNARLTIPLYNSGVSWFADYSGFSNRVPALGGVVWNEHSVRIGLTYLFGGSNGSEPMWALPGVLRVVTKF